MKAVLLSRVSSKEQEEGHSLVAQSHRLHNYCKNKGLEILKEFIIVESSTRGERPEFKHMIAFIKKQKDKIALVCDKVDRLQRSFREVPILEDLRRSGRLALHFVSENQVLDDKANNSQIMAYQIFVMMAENYTNCISDNVKRSFEKKLQEGTILANAPVGYVNTTINGKKTVIIDPERGNKIRDMFNAYAKGLTSIRNLVEYAKSIHLQHRNGHPLTRSQIQLMLHNPFYYGEMKVKGKLYPHIYEPLISKELFNICNKITTTRHCESTSKSKDSFLLSGFVRCKYCGNLYSPYKSKGKYAFLQPPVNRNCKHHHNLSESMVIAVINEQLAQLKMGKNKKTHLLKVIENKYQQELQKRTENILKLDSELSHMKHKEKRLVDLLISDKISQEMFEQTSKEIEDSKKDIQDKIARYDIRIEEFFSNMKKIVKIAEISQKMFKSSSFLKKRALLKTITSNFFTDGKNAVISIRKPFEICLQRVSCPTWLGQLDSNQ